ncbi:MAG: hypothetical protein PHC98_00965 [Syntrophotalea acetylenica]|nr:hypothetical protein [Syntrophotalea acetylenica]
MNSQIIFYASGMSSVADFEGFAQAGHPVGVMAQDVSARVSNKIWGYAAQGGRVFVDSGAFPAFIRGTAVDFDAVFDFYRELAGNCLFPQQLALVAPDVIGAMEKTAELQWQYLADMQQLVGLGAELIVPFQTGWPPERYREHFEALRHSLGAFTVGFAYNKAAWQAEEVAALVEALDLGSIHLFGIGRKRVGPTIRVLLDCKPELVISCDANRLRAMLGKGRKLTTAIDASLEKERGRARSELYAQYLRPGEHPLSERVAQEIFADRWDDTEFCHDVYHVPGFLTPGEARVLAAQRGITDSREIAQWAKWSQEWANEGFHVAMSQRFPFTDPFGCKLGYLLEMTDLSGQSVLSRLPEQHATVVSQAQANAARPLLRTENVARIAREEQEEGIDLGQAGDGQMKWGLR